MLIFLAIFLFAMWSNSFVLGKMLLQHAPPLFLTSTRMLLAGFILLSFLFIFRRKNLKLKKEQLIPILLLAIFSIYLTNACEFWGLQHLSAAKTSFIYSLSPFFAALLSYFHFKEKLTVKKAFGLMIGFIGFLPVLYMQTGSEDLMESITFLSWPSLAIIGAALFSVYGWVLLRMLVKDGALSPSMANGTSMLIGGIFALIHSLIIDNWQPLPVANINFFPLIKGLVLITLLSNVLCYNLYGFLLKKFTATFLSFVGLLSPIFASLSAWIFLGERPSYIILLSTFIVALGLWMVYQAELKQGYIRKKVPALEP